MIKGNNISLRAPEPEDIQKLFEWENDRSLWHLSNTVAPFSRYMLEQYILSASNDIFSQKQLRLMIDLLDNSEKTGCIGIVDLFDFEPIHKRAGIGILLHSDYREKGFASQTLDLLMAYAKETLLLHQLYCNIETNNTVSIRLFQKKGFIVSGTKLQWNFHGNQWHDELFLQCLL
ncbi:MAG: GNAT family N-acetyltransferase [Lentimicrobiaceae bacterium]|nr:GNAT family N-acetyltransferase [Lentimicrobiaceae bacterium]